jgi:hypothetical protein
MRPDSLPEMDNRPRVARRYQRPRSGISWVGVILGLILGIGGGLLYTWVLSPVVEFDTQPWQLNAADRQRYIVAIMAEYGHTGDFNRTFQRLLALLKPIPSKRLRMSPASWRLRAIPTTAAAYAPFAR